MSQNNLNIKAGVIIVLILLVILYLISLGNADFLTDDGEEQKRKLEEKRKRLDDRYNRVQDILNRKKELKIKLEAVRKRVLFGVRLTLAILFLFSLSFIHIYYSVSVLDLISYVGAVTLLLVIIGFVCIGGPTNFFKIWTYFEKKLILKIYGKYIDIDKHIESHEKELQKILSDRTAIDNELKESVHIEVDLREVPSEKNQ